MDTLTSQTLLDTTTEISGQADTLTAAVESLDSANLLLSQSTGVENLLPEVQHVETLSPLLQWVNDTIPALSGFNELQILGLGFGVMIWVLAIFWTLRDAMARSESIGFQLFSAVLVAVLSPVIGLPLYLAFRPLTYLWERGYWREAIVAKTVFCPHCESLVDSEHKACIYCGEALQTECKECQTKYYRGYHYCPECGAPNLD